MQFPPCFLEFSSVRLFVPCLAILVSACAADTKTRAVDQLPEQTRQLLKQPFPVYAGSTAVQDKPFEDPQHPGKELMAALPPDVRARVRHHPALDWAATACAQDYAINGRKPGEAVNRWVLWKVGVGNAGYCNASAALVKFKNRRAQASAAPGEVAATLAAASKRYFGEHIQGTVDTLQKHPGPVAFGMARLQAGPTKNVQAIFVAFEELQLQPFPKNHAAGAAATLVGRFAVPVGGAYLLLDFNDEGGLRVNLTVAADGTFSAPLVMPEQPGRYFLEVWSSKPGESAVSLRLTIPVYVGLVEPDQPELPQAAVLLDTTSATQWPALILAEFNQARAKQGLAPLKANSAMNVAAQRQAALLAANKDLPPDPALHATLAAAGMDSYAENQHRTSAENAQEMIAAQLVSPGARRKLLSAEATDFGMGMARGESWTQFVYFVAATRPGVPLPQQREAALAAFAKARATLNLPMPPEDPALQARADRAASRLCAGEARQAVIDSELAHARELGLAFKILEEPFVSPQRFVKTIKPWTRKELVGWGMSLCERGAGADRTQHVAMVVSGKAAGKPVFEDVPEETPAGP